MDARPRKDAGDDATVVLQVTDTHLFPSPDGTLLGVHTQASFEAVLDTALAQGSPDALILTGDLAQVGTTRTYQNLLATVGQRFDGPLLCVPGNHDIGADFAGVLPSAPIELGGWTILGVDTHIDDSTDGHVGAAELGRLEQALAASRGHLLVAGHHAPVTVATRWLDRQRIDDADALLGLLEAYNVRGYAFGHVHQAFEHQHGNLRCLAAPSTCFQFKGGSDEFAIDQKLPGWRWLHLHRDGTLSSRVERLPDFELTLDLTDTKY